jgi:hypothetical protein
MKMIERRNQKNEYEIFLLPIKSNQSKTSLIFPAVVALQKLEKEKNWEWG